MARDTVYRQPFRKNLRRLYDYLDRKLADSAEGAAANGAVATESGCGAIHKTTLTLDEVAIALTDHAGVVAYGGKKFYDFPAGFIRILGAVADLDVVKSSAGVNDTFDGDFALGSATAGNNNALASTEADILASTSTPQAVDGETTAKGGSGTGVVLDGSVTPADLFLNFLVDDADHNVGATPANLVVSGTITITWMNLGAYA